MKDYLDKISEIVSELKLKANGNYLSFYFTATQLLPLLEELVKRMEKEVAE